MGCVAVPLYAVACRWAVAYCLAAYRDCLRCLQEADLAVCRTCAVYPGGTFTMLQRRQVKYESPGTVHDRL